MVAQSVKRIKKGSPRRCKLTEVSSIPGHSIRWKENNRRAKRGILFLKYCSYGVEVPPCYLITKIKNCLYKNVLICTNFSLKDAEL